MNERQSIIRRVTWIGACLDGVLAAIKIVIGWLVHSPALVADGFHSLSDLLTDVAVVVFSGWAAMAPDDDHPYGHHRYETLGTVILGTTLVVIASFIAWDSVLRLLDEAHLPQASVWAIGIAIISILSKEWIFRYTLAAAKRIRSHLLEANAWHSRSDALSSVVVLVGVLATWLGYPQVELIAAILVAVLIGKMGVKLTWNATQDLVDRGIDPKEAQEIEVTIRSTEGVVDVHMLRSRMMGNHIYLDVHIQVSPQVSVSEGHTIAEKVMARVHDSYDDVSDITVHVDYEEDLEGSVQLIGGLPSRSDIEACLQQAGIDYQRVQIHYQGQHVMLELYLSEAPKESQLHAMEQLKSDSRWLADYRCYLELPLSAQYKV